MVKNPPVNAGDVGSIPGSGMYATTIEPVLQSPGITTTEPTCPKPSNVKPAHHNERVAPLSITREKPAQQQGPGKSKMNQ